RPAVNEPSVAKKLVEVALVKAASVAVRSANVAVPVNVGDSLNTRLPVPVVPVTDEARLAAVMVLVRFFEPSVATRREAVRPEVVPGAAAMAPEELTPKGSPLRTVKKYAGEVSPTPTRPVPCGISAMCALFPVVRRLSVPKFEPMNALPL